MWGIPRCRLASLLIWMGLIGLALLVSGCEKSARPGEGFTAIDITGATYATRLELSDAQGQPRQLTEFKGKVVVVFFGYTQCPDVCPTTLADLAQVRQSLGADGARVQPVFVTLDPERDTPEVLKAYAANFGDDVVALTGTAEQIQAAAKEFKLFYAKVPGRTADTYTLDHTAGAWIFDAQGQVRLFMRHGQPVPAVAADIKRLLSS